MLQDHEGFVCGVLLLQIDDMLKNAWMVIRGLFMEVKVDHNSDIEGSSTFLEQYCKFLCTCVIIGRFILL